MGPQRIKIGLFGSALAAGVVLLLLVFHPRVAPIARALAILQGHALAAEPAPKAAKAAVTAGALEERSRLADLLNSPAGDIHADLRILNEIFIAYRGAVRSGNPVGENNEITAALTGRNKLGYAFIPADCSAISSRGELCDRWGTPFFFHQLSGEKMEVHSAGPDRRLWTPDDEVLTP